ncbi:ABC 3 transport family protein [Lentilactobacillus kisonensis F0435]|uniref:ABC 3 transport family protein n=1 Tax=Lentilactobacillus kisonensis F0435 TaxID=797516 RepID=H1LIP6_9LACO|nr:ABC 3 transport family protein [Lentilactobacillus kisonensis F0435]
MFSFEFMQNAYLAGTLIAIVSGMMGVFVVARNMPFMTHTLSEIGFAGAAFGIFIGWTPLNGMLAFTTVSSIMVGELSGAVESRRESVISAISGLFIGLGILFLSLSRKNASYATNILFGSVIGISRQDVIQMAALSILVLVVLLLIFRNLKDDSFDAIGSQTNHIHRNLISIIFLIMLAFSVERCCPNCWFVIDLRVADVARLKREIFCSHSASYDVTRNSICVIWGLGWTIFRLSDKLAGNVFHCLN